MVNPQAIRHKLGASLEAQDPQGVAQIVRLPPIASTKRPYQSGAASSMSLEIGGINYTGLLQGLVDAHGAAEAGQASQCYQAQASVHSHMIRVLGTSEGSWLIPALIVVCRMTHKVARAADQAEGPPNQQAKLQAAVQLLQESYSKTFNDRTEYQVRFCERGRQIIRT